MKRYTHLFVATAVMAALLGSSPALASRKSAIAYMEAHGYSPVNKAQYHKRQAIRFLVGVKTFGCCTGGRKAFFFVRHRGFQRTDVHHASRTALRGAGQSNKAIAVRYGPLYRPSDPNCCPAGGYKVVRFRWNGSKVTTLDRIPSGEKRGAI